MESAIRLRCCAPLNLSYGSKGSQFARPRNFHLRFNHAIPLCLPHFSTTRHQVAPPFRHVSCMLQTFFLPSENEGSDNKVLRGVTQVSLVLACVLGVFNFSSKMNPKITTAYANPHPPSTIPNVDTLDSSSMIPCNGRFALGSLLKTLNEAEEPSDRNQSLPPPYQREPDDDAVNKLKLCAIRLSKSGKSADALKRLKEEYKKHKDSSAGDNLGFALAELLIFQGKFEEARKLLDEINEELSDAKDKTPKEKSERLLKLYDEENRTSYEKRQISQLVLYKAIVHTMLEDKDKKARGWWKGREAVEWREAFIQLLDK